MPASELPLLAYLVVCVGTFPQHHAGGIDRLMLGSLNKVWPWKEVVETFVDSHGEVKPLIETNILPNAHVQKQ